MRNPLGDHEELPQVPHMLRGGEEPPCPTSKPSPGWLTVLQGDTADTHLASHHRLLFCKSTLSQEGCQ